MKKTLLFLALGAFMAASVSANACDGAKATTSKKGTPSCCAAKGTKVAKASGQCTAAQAAACTAKQAKNGKSATKTSTATASATKPAVKTTSVN